MLKTTLTSILFSVILITVSCSNREPRERQPRQDRQFPMKNSMLVKQTDTVKVDTVQPITIDTSNQSTDIKLNDKTTTSTEIINSDINSTYVRVENTKHKTCQYYEEIDFILKSKLQLYIEQQNKPIQYFSQWTLDLYDIKYTRNEIIEYYENKIGQELEVLIKVTKFNFNNVDMNKPIVIGK